MFSLLQENYIITIELIKFCELFNCLKAYFQLITENMK
jgi:hypothetical protein